MIPMRSFFLAAFLGLTLAVPSWAVERSWTGQAGTDEWEDAANWLPASPPTSADDVFLNLADASATISGTFEAKSITVGGNEASTLAVEQFVSGTVEPASTSEVALWNRRDGVVVIRGSGGEVTLKGQYKDSEDSLAKQRSLVLRIQ